MEMTQVPGTARSGPLSAPEAEALEDMITRGMTLDQVKAARPTKDYDPRYDVPGWTKDQFVEAVYRSLAQKRQ